MLEMFHEQFHLHSQFLHFLLSTAFREKNIHEHFCLLSSLSSNPAWNDYGFKIQTWFKLSLMEVTCHY